MTLPDYPAGLSKVTETGHSRMDSETRLMALVVVTLGLTDLVTTYYGIRHAGLIETNQLGAHVLDSYGMAGLAAVKVSLTVAIVGCLWIASLCKGQASANDNESVRTACAASQWIAATTVCLVWGYASLSNTALILL